MACRSILNTSLSTVTAVTAGGIVPLGSAVHGSGKGATLNGNTITLKGTGKTFYRISAHCSVAPTADSEITLSALDGTAVIDQAIALPAAAGGPVDLSIETVVYIPCGCSGAHTISFTLSAAGSVDQMAVVVTQA